jgi:hypothetical protein
MSVLTSRQRAAKQLVSAHVPQVRDHSAHLLDILPPPFTVSTEECDVRVELMFYRLCL